MSMARHTLIVTIIVAALSAVLVIFFLNVPVLPVMGTREAISVDNLFVLMFCIASVVFVLALVVLVYSMIVFRAGPGDNQDGPHMRGNNALEVTWSFIPLAIVLGLAVYGANVLNDMNRPVPGELEVRVVSAQWSWSFEYPAQGISTSELRLPVNQAVLLRLNSVDVVHSFFVPEFRVKQDAVPGIETTLRLNPILTGNYQVLCAELCGLLHAYMTAPVAVVDQAEFDRWVQEQKH